MGSQEPMEPMLPMLTEPLIHNTYLMGLSMIKWWKELVPANQKLSHHKFVDVYLRNTNTFFDGHAMMPT